MAKLNKDLAMLGTAAFYPVAMQADTGAGTETPVADDKADTEPARKKVADHYLIDANGAKVEDEELATGIGYQIVGTAKSFEFQVGGAAGQPATMLAVFGAKTLATNESSAARNRKEDPADAEGQMEAVRERFTLIGTGKWVDRTRDGVGAKIDLDALAGAIVDVATAAGKAADYAAFRQKLEEDPAFKKMVRQVPAIATAYAARVGRQSKTLDDVLGAITA